jgi:hypothetical protein
MRIFSSKTAKTSIKRGRKKSSKPLKENIK